MKEEKEEKRKGWEQDSKLVARKKYWPADQQKKRISPRSEVSSVSGIKVVV